MTGIGYALGMLSGVTALSIAIYLEWIAEGQCDIKYVVTYLGLGLGLVLVSSRELFLPEFEPLTVIGFLIIITFELLGLMHIRKRFTGLDPTR